MAKYLYVNIVNCVAKIVNQLFVIHVLQMIKIHVPDVEKEILTQNKITAFL
jgi:hypothetical protein